MWGNVQASGNRFVFKWLKNEKKLWSVNIVFGTKVKKLHCEIMFDLVCMLHPVRFQALNHTEIQQGAHVFHFLSGACVLILAH